MACCRHTNEKTAERRGWTHGTRRAFAGDRLGESDAPAMPKLERCRSARALPAVPLTCHAWHVDGRHGWRGSMSCTMCRVAPIICAADPDFFCAAASNFHELLMPDPSQTSGYVPHAPKGAGGGSRRAYRKWSSLGPPFG